MIRLEGRRGVRRTPTGKEACDVHRYPGASR